MSTRSTALVSDSSRGFWQAFVSTGPGWGPAVARLGLAAMMWPHGAQKLLGWFGGYGFEGTVGAMTQGGMPAPVAILVVLGEFFGPILLATGFLTRFAAASLAVIMIGAVAMVHWPNGFFADKNGWEMHLLAITLALSLVVSGAGSASVDRRLTKGE
jgi:putative oxidoreductase